MHHWFEYHDPIQMKNLTPVKTFFQDLPVFDASKSKTP